MGNNLFLAPMAGITDTSFRLLCKHEGCGLVYTEMISAKGLYYGNDKTTHLLTIKPAERPVAVQIFGSDPGLMAEMALRLSDGTADIIDINMGCPTPKIVKNGDGAALLKNPRLVGEIVRRVSEAIRVPLTIKIRKGWDENSINAAQIAYIARENGAAAIAVHGRTRNQFYSGEADWHIIKEIKDMVDIPVIGNGDVFSPRDTVEMIEMTGCDAVMIGRGARGNPWIFSSTAHYMKTNHIPSSPDACTIVATIKRHITLMAQYKGQKTAVKEIRKHIGWYVKGLRNANTIRYEVNNAQNTDQILDILQFYMGKREEHL